MAVVGRIALWSVPNVQPVTVIVILVSVYLGGYWGVLSAVVTSVVTNLLMGSLGLWTVYQALAWAAVGLLSYFTFKHKKELVTLFLWSIAAAYIYGVIINLCSWQTLSSQTGTGGILAYELSGVLFDTYHAIGNGVFMLVLEPILRRFTAKYHFTQNTKHGEV